MRKVIFIFILLMFWKLNAEPFNTCPSKAFLVQGTNATVYGVNLVSGEYKTFSNDIGTGDKFNGLGFSVHDRYIYGWDYKNQNLGRLNKDYKLEKLEASNFPLTNFYVGDVSVQENAYYSYKKGADYGLYRFSLNPEDSNYLVAEKIINGSELNLNIFDLAFHPNENKELGVNANIAFSVDSNGNLHKINVENGKSENLGNVGFSGTFGAVYFDVEGNFYISRNSDGNIFIIDINNPSGSVLFAYGPNSNNNDGARCATAPIINEEEDPTIDFDDAPKEYGNKISQRARHTVGNLYFGKEVTAEHQFKLIDEDDGVQIVTSLETGKEAIVIFEVSNDSYVNAWIDWNKNYKFEEEEKIINEHFSSKGVNRLLIEVPLEALEGNTWARFRVSNQINVEPIGGVDNGEVEDIQVTIIESGITEIMTSWKTVAFEDMWPKKGDYDFNDVVVKYKITKSEIENKTVKYKIEGELLAIGATYHNGFAFHFSQIKRNEIKEELIRYEIEGKQENRNPLEKNRNNAILIIFEDTKKVAPILSGCKYFRTESKINCRNQKTINFEITLPIKEEYALLTDISQIDPFIFGVNGYNHGEYVDKENARQWEVHLKNKNPTEAFDLTYFDNADDRSTIYGNYQTENGLPWAMIINSNWYHPKENIDITEVYTEFAKFAESSGKENVTWFNNPVISKSIKN